MVRVQDRSFEGDVRRFLELRADSSIDDQEFANLVCELPLFQEKLALAKSIVMRRDAEADDAAQDAFLCIRDHLAKTRGKRFVGSTADELGGWFYCLARQHLRWWRLNHDRRENRRKYYEQMAAKSEVVHPGTSSSTLEGLDVIDALLRLPEQERRVAAAYLRGEQVGVTAKRMRISRRTYHRVLNRAADLMQQ